MAGAKFHFISGAKLSLGIVGDLTRALRAPLCISYMSGPNINLNLNYGLNSQTKGPSPFRLELSLEASPGTRGKFHRAIKKGAPAGPTAHTSAR